MRVRMSQVSTCLRPVTPDDVPLIGRVGLTVCDHVIRLGICFELS